MQKHAASGWRIRPCFDTASFAPPWNILSRAMILAVAAFARLVMAAGQRQIRLVGAERFLKARDSSRGLITGTKGRTMDDPLMWGMFPLRTWTRGRIRWALAAADICFTGPFRALFFSLGQTLPTERYGAGLFQTAIEDAIRLVSDPARAWIHVFPEGRVQQHPQHTIHYFRWGISRIILEAAVRSNQLPYVLPIFLRGFDQISPELHPVEFQDMQMEKNVQLSSTSVILQQLFQRFLKQPYLFLQRFPRFGYKIEAHFGPPIPDAQLATFVDVWRELCQKTKTSNTETYTGNVTSGTSSHHPNAFEPFPTSSTIDDSPIARQLRSDLAALLHQHVSRLCHEASRSDISDTKNDTLLF
ncbi:hypothetical protein PORY_000643 [Pneumocystis oryctolagi]|uniref:Uncharacterized protein n=1 Tax=Pneumocystis oryctolagi TaxID=42067 RepID=A0ACB7CFG9_9ASCO|nr:hypothetical protein PORY_000643 [Pneumocystis oryctolagi]